MCTESVGISLLAGCDTVSAFAACEENGVVDLMKGTKSCEEMFREVGVHWEGTHMCVCI